MIVGRFVPGAFRALPAASYMALGAESVPHQVYEVWVRTVPMAPEQEREVAGRLMSASVPGMVVLGVEAKGDAVRIQVTGSPFFWEPFLAILPAIIGPIIALVIGLVFIYRIPEWAWAAIPLGIGGAVLIYAIIEARK